MVLFKKYHVNVANYAYENWDTLWKKEYKKTIATTMHSELCRHRHRWHWYTRKVIKAIRVKLKPNNIIRVKEAEKAET